MHGVEEQERLPRIIQKPAPEGRGALRPVQKLEVRPDSNGVSPTHGLKPLDGQWDLQGADAHSRVRQSHQSLEGAINERRPKQEAKLRTVPFHLQPREAFPLALLDLHLSDAPEAPLEREATLHAKRVHEVHVHLLRAAPPELCQVVLVLLRTLPSACLPDEARLNVGGHDVVLGVLPDRALHLQAPVLPNEEPQLHWLLQLPRLRETENQRLGKAQALDAPGFLLSEVRPHAGKDHLQVACTGHHHLTMHDVV
mmetsp:Transcript_47783/g.113850  ORF Transcript_47783/g.113850 Transcript_47783/m.113850 type:complete len:254 (-) Transcript_47783:120-881(-)